MAVDPIQFFHQMKNVDLRQQSSCSTEGCGEYQGWDMRISFKENENKKETCAQDQKVKNLGTHIRKRTELKDLSLSGEY